MGYRFRLSTTTTEDILGEVITESRKHSQILGVSQSSMLIIAERA